MMDIIVVHLTHSMGNYGIEYVSRIQFIQKCIYVGEDNWRASSFKRIVIVFRLPSFISLLLTSFPIREVDAMVQKMESSAGKSH